MKKPANKWNVIVTVRDLKRACDVLSAFGRVQLTDYHDTLVMNVQDVPQMLETLRTRSLVDPESLNFLSRLTPVKRAFNFKSSDDFENKSYKQANAWLRKLGNKGFHVRIHCRGFKEQISTFEVEEFLNDMLMEDLRMADSQGHITFKDPDVVIAVETVRNRVGVTLLTREELQRYPFVRTT